MESLVLLPNTVLVQVHIKYLLLTAHSNECAQGSFLSHHHGDALLLGASVRTRSRAGGQS